MSREVTSGVYLISFEKAQELVSAGRAKTSDFMLFLGYCGWIRNQLQGELNVGSLEDGPWDMLRTRVRDCVLNVLMPQYHTKSGLSATALSLLRVHGLG